MKNYAIYTTNDRTNNWKWYCDCADLTEANTIMNYLENRRKTWEFISMPGTQYKIVAK